MLHAYRTIVTALAAVALLSATACSSAERSQRANDERTSTEESRVVAPKQKEHRDVAYGEVSRRQVLDLFLPNDADGPFPLIVYIHGGGYMSGSKAELTPEIRRAAHTRGYAVASIDYRLLDESDYPTQINDVKAAIRWLKEHADEYALDAHSVATWGFSAGGHLSALAATSGFVTELEDPAYDGSGPNSTVRAAIDWAGPADFFAIERMLDQRRRQGTYNPRYELSYLSDEVKSDPALVRSADPATHADPGDPPVLIQHGRLDGVVPVTQSEYLAEQLRAQIGEDKVELRIEPKSGHVSPVFWSAANIERTLDWLDAALGR